MTYITKQSVIETFKYDGNLQDSNGTYYIPEWAVKAVEEGSLRHARAPPRIGTTELYIIRETENEFQELKCVNKGDYIVKDKQGKLHVCKQKEFEETYMPLSDISPMFKG